MRKITAMEKLDTEDPRDAVLKYAKVREYFCIIPHYNAFCRWLKRILTGLPQPMAGLFVLSFIAIHCCCLASTYLLTVAVTQDTTRTSVRRNTR